MENELLILEKTYDAIKYLHQALQQYPKSERYTLCAKTEDAADEFLKLIITANKRYYKKTTMQDADIQLAVLRYRIRLGYDYQFLPIKKFEQLCKKISEIGRMLGGWIKAMQK